MVRVARARAAKTVLLWVLVCWLVVGPACDNDPVFPENRRPFVYLILNQTVELNGEPVQPAFLLTIVRADSVVYRGAERFEMRRLSDGALFDWTSERADVSLDFGIAGPRMQSANWLLADSATSAGLGQPSLEPGETYELVVETGSEVIRGKTTIPDTFSVSVLERDGQRVAVWPTVDGAVAYSVDAVGVDEPFYDFQPDTTYELDAAATAVSVRAVGPHAFRYATDEDARRAGIEGGLGVFGAIQEVKEQIPSTDSL